jgi:hypothetical protein
MKEKEYDFSAFDNDKLKLASKLNLHLKHLGILGLVVLVLLSIIISPLLFAPGLVALAILLLMLLRLCSQAPGDVFARQNQLRRPFMKTDSYYYFLYEEYKEAMDSALSKRGAVPWGLPVDSGELGIAFFDNLDVLVWGRLSKNFPHLVVDATGNDRFLGNNIDHKQLPIEKVSLEGNFPDYFKVYVERGQEVLSLQILSPDRMAGLIDHMPKFDLEIKGNHIKIYGVKIQQSSESMRAFMKVLQSLHDDLKISRLQDTRVK